MCRVLSLRSAGRNGKGQPVAVDRKPPEVSIQNKSIGSRVDLQGDRTSGRHGLVELNGGRDARAARNVPGTVDRNGYTKRHKRAGTFLHCPAGIRFEVLDKPLKKIVSFRDPDGQAVGIGLGLEIGSRRVLHGGIQDIESLLVPPAHITDVSDHDQENDHEQSLGQPKVPIGKMEIGVDRGMVISPEHGVLFSFPSGFFLSFQKGQKERQEGMAGCRPEVSVEPRPSSGRHRLSKTICEFLHSNETGRFFDH